MSCRAFSFFVELHRWVGFALSVLFLIIILSGLALGIESLIRRIDDHGQVYRPLSLKEQALAIETLWRRYPQASAVTVPTESRPFFRVSTRAGSTFHAIEGLALVHEMRRGSDSLRRFLIGLHRNFLKGRPGRHVVAWVSILSVAIGVIGIVAWWPLRRRFRLRDVIPSSFARPNLFRLHYTAGVLALAFLIVLGLTGVGITYRQQAHMLLGVERNVLTRPFETPYYVAESWRERILAAQPYLEGGRFVGISRPRAPRGSRIRLAANRTLAPMDAVQIRFFVPGDWHGAGASMVLLDEPRSAIVGVSHFREKAFGQKLGEMMRPLHDGFNMPTGYVVFLIAVAAVLFLVVTSGLFSFFQKTYQPTGAPDWHAARQWPWSRAAARADSGSRQGRRAE